MNAAAIALLALVLGLFVFDWVTLRGKNRRALFFEGLIFLVGAFFIAFPERATIRAHVYLGLRQSERTNENEREH